MALAHRSDVFGNLLTMSFRGVVFDAESVGLEVKQATVTHVYPGRDGGRTEHLGRDPNAHRFRIPFLRSLDQDLYPNRWRAFLVAFSDGSTGPLVHPELGEVKVKPISASQTWSAGARAGVWVDAVFIESDEDGEAFARSLKKKAPYFLVEANAAKAKAALAPLDFGPDAGDLFDKLDAAVAQFRKVTGAIDVSRMLVSNVFAAVAGVIAAANGLMVAVEKTWDPRAYEGLVALVDVCNGAADQAAEIAGKKVVAKTLRRDLRVEAAAKFVGASLEDFLRFNAGFADASVVPSGTIVFAPGK